MCYMQSVQWCAWAVLLERVAAAPYMHLQYALQDDSLH
jgi:hypothetical protein